MSSLGIKEPLILPLYGQQECGESALFDGCCLEGVHLNPSRAKIGIDPGQKGPFEC